MLYFHNGTAPQMFVRSEGQLVPVTALAKGQTPPAGLIDPATPAAQQPIGPSDMAFRLSFSDEFAAGILNASRWIPWYPDTPFWNATTPGGHRTNTGEPQGYDPSGISFDTDGLVLTMRNSNAAVPQLPYTSGMICSYPSFAQSYGFFEAKMKLANVDGSWPAFWMDCADQSWPPEIDIMENWGAASWNTSVTHTYHYPQPTPGGYSATKYDVPVGDVGTSWHTYGCLWEPGRLRWYVDGVLTKDLVDANVTDKAMYMICNLAGRNYSTPPAVADLPFSIHVRYIRAWALPA